MSSASHSARPGEPTGPGFAHHALLHESPQALLDTALPFLAEGLAAGETVVLVCRAEHDALLTEALGGDERILHLARPDPDARGMQVVADRRRLVHEQRAAGAPRVRMLGELPLDDRGRGWAAWHRFEAACNVALAGLPLTAVCAYDARHLPARVRHGVEETHPVLLTAAGSTRNQRYVDPATVLRRSTTGRPDPVPPTAPTLELVGLTDAGGLAEVRVHLRAALGRATGPEQHRADFATAVGEVLANAFTHGRPPVELRLWAGPAGLVCTVTDRGPGFDDPLAGYLPPHATSSTGPAPPGAGLWLARQTSDTLDTQRTPIGFTVRLTSRPPAPGTAVTTGTRTAHARVAAAADRARARAHELRNRLSEHTDPAAGLDADGGEVAPRPLPLRNGVDRRRR